ncbi:outer membrane lipoprotein Blc [Microbulbifer aestuariivivens]|uniref:Outer membrane lipoprotein Blc n=1 Tax=Microbulbifer aestuariivivens TaxID=1908308 RepID=A0ABP9WQJ4_9GAMM
MNMKKWLLSPRSLPLLLLSLALSACTGLPENVAPVQDFALQRYLGKWYEIARLDHSFERGMTHVTAEYSLNADGSVRVINRGFQTEDGEWEKADGRAKFVGSDDVGHLKVSFFGPFYASYVVFELGGDYQYAMVSGFSKSNLWILARQPQLPQKTLDKLVAQARAKGFPTEQLIFVDQSQPPPVAAPQ